jgi:hypothetical protein
MATYVPAKRGVEFIFGISLVSQADTKLLQNNPTLASGDVTISKDFGAFANLTTLPTVTPASGDQVKVTVSATEMTADNIMIVFSDAAGAQWCDVSIPIQTAARQIDDLAYPATSGRSMVVDAAGLVDANTVKVGPTGTGTAQTAGDVIGDTNDIQARLPAALVSGRIDASVGAMAAAVVTAAAIATDAIDADALSADALAEINAQVDLAITDVNLDHLVGTATGIPAIPAGTYLDQIMDDGTAVFDRTTDSLQAIRDNMSAGAGDWTAGEKEQIRHRIGIDGTASAPAATPSLATAANLATVAGYIDTEIADIQTRLPAALVGGRMASIAEVVGDKTGYALTSADHTLIADALLKRDMSAVTGEAARSPLNSFRFLRNKWSLAASTLTVTKEDDITTAWTAAISTDAAAVPVIGSDPA